MKPESTEQTKRFLAARYLLLDAREQYEASIGALKGALARADADVAMSERRDEEAARQVAAMRAVVARLPALEPIDAIADTMEALAHEVTTDEEHVPAGVS